MDTATPTFPRERRTKFLIVGLGVPVINRVTSTYHFEFPSNGQFHYAVNLGFSEYAAVFYLMSKP
jgi:hypothetical protein